MRPSALFFATVALFSSALAVDVRKSVIITYPSETPDHVLDQAKQAITDAGGVVTHEYQMIKGFAASVGEKVLETVSGWGKPYNALVEEDELVSAL